MPRKWQSPFQTAMRSVQRERRSRPAAPVCGAGVRERDTNTPISDSHFPKYELEIFSKCIPPLQDFILQTVREDHAVRWKHSTVALNSVTIIYGFYLRLEPLSLALVGK